MVDEIEGGKFELQTLVFRELEVLEQTQIAVPEHRASHVGRMGSIAQLARRCRTKAVRIDELILTRDPLGGVTGDRRVQGDVRRTK